MTAAIWRLLVALAILTAAYGSEAGVLDYRGRPTVLLCDPAACVTFTLADGHIVTVAD